jgi:hypothetical protein
MPLNCQQLLIKIEEFLLGAIMGLSYHHALIRANQACGSIEAVSLQFFVCSAGEAVFTIRMNFQS